MQGLKRLLSLSKESLDVKPEPSILDLLTQKGFTEGTILIQPRAEDSQSRYEEITEVRLDNPILNEPCFVERAPFPFYSLSFPNILFLARDVKDKIYFVTIEKGEVRAGMLPQIGYNISSKGHGFDYYLNNYKKHTITLPIVRR